MLAFLIFTSCATEEGMQPPLCKQPFLILRIVARDIVCDLLCALCCSQVPISSNCSSDFSVLDLQITWKFP